ncbi:MAG: hypothetical protein Q8P81_01135 [Nanoarchaeota archaeon]|nr:hypothetical protein [Nanoarchaeota archaeon]
MTDTSPLMLSHYAGHAVVKARWCLAEGETEVVDDYRVRLLGQLRGLDSDLSITACISYLENRVWKTDEDIDVFKKYSDKEFEKMRSTRLHSD